MARMSLSASRPEIFYQQVISKRMKDDRIVFAMANPDPEVNPTKLSKICRVFATGRSDFPNQINNALAFPGIFRGL